MTRANRDGTASASTAELCDPQDNPGRPRGRPVTQPGEADVKKPFLPVIWAAVVASLAASPSLLSQSQADAPVQGPTFRTGVDVIAVDVAVVDRAGKPVDDLRAPDFAVKIDGVPRRVVSAEQVRFDVEPARKQAATPFETTFTTNLTPPNGRLIVIAVDHASIRTAAARPLMNSAAKFLDALSPADRIALVAYPEPGVRVDFTTDRLRLKLAMERIVGYQRRYTGRFSIGLYEAIAIAERHDGRTYAIVVGRECGRLSGPSLENCERELLGETATIVQLVREETMVSLRGLYELLAQLGTIEGPKSLILLSEGLILEHPDELDSVIRAAARSRVSVNVLLMDVPRDDITSGQLGPTVSEDRELQVQGLRELAAGTRGTIYNVIGSGDRVFERLSSELSAYYLLAIERSPEDRDGRHRVDVEVRRRDVTVRSHRAFVLSSPASRRQKPEDALVEALRAPFGVAEVPLRLTTFAQQDTAGAKVRVVVAAEVGQPGAARAEYTIGYALVDSDGKVVASAAERRALAPPDGTSPAPLEYLHEMVVEPGTYSLRFGVVDPEGRRGAVVRDVNAWKLADEEFAVGDLMVGEVEAASSQQRLRLGVEPRVRTNLGTLLELYSTSAAVLEGVTVTFEVADDQDAPALLAQSGAILPGAQPTRRAAQAVLTPAWLPPGRYIARARVMRDGNVAAVMVRPFLVEAPAADASGVLPAPAGLVIGEIAKFDPAVVLARDVVGGMLDQIEKSSPAMKGALFEARAGRYAAAAVEAFDAGDQTVAAFLKGLDWSSKGQLDQAATQLQIAAGPRREFFPAAFYLGAAFAAVGRDREASAVWQMALGSEPRPPLAYTLFADARMRTGDAASVVDVLRAAYDRTPADDGIGRRLAAAYLMAGRYAEAVPVLDGYLSRHPADDEALFAAVFAQYQLTSRERLKLTAADEIRIRRYVRAYAGPQQALLSKYLESMRAR